MRRVGFAVVALLALAISAQTALAYFTGTLAASATATATTLLAGATPTTTVNGRAITVSWSTTGFASGGQATGYSLVRYSNAAPTVAIVPSNGCAGVIVATACTETGLAAGAWRYAVVPRAGSAWIGPEGTASVAATVAAPSLALTLVTVAGPLPRSLSGTLGGFNPLEALTYRLDNSTTGTVLTGTPAAANAQGGGTVAVTLPATTDGSHTIFAVGAGGSQASAAVLVDTVAPVTTDSTTALGNAWTSQSRTVTLTPTDAGSGTAATYFTSNGTTPTTASSQGTSVVLNTDGIFTVKYFSVDVAGNAEAVKTAGTAIRIDRTAPTPAALTTTGAVVVGSNTVIANGQALTDAATDPTVNGASSGVASVTYYYCAGTCTPTPGAGGTTLIGTSTSSSAYSVPWNSQPADGTYSLRARVTDVAGTTADSAVVARVVDNTGPVVTGTLADAQANQSGYINRNDTFYAYANVADSGAGVNAGSVTADLSVQCGASCNSIALSATGGPFTVLTAAGSTTYTYRSAVVTSNNSGSGSYSLRASDGIGASGSYSGSVTVDNASSVATPSTVTLTTGYAASSFATCPVTANGYINAANVASETVTVGLGSSAPANGVVALTATVGGTTLRFTQVATTAGTSTVTFSGLAFGTLGDGTVTLSAIEYSGGGNAVSSARTQTVTKLTTTPTVTTGSLVYTDNTSPTADRASSTTAVGPAAGYLAFTQTAGTRVATTYLPAVLSGTGVLSSFSLAAESASPTYAVTAVDAACNVSAIATWKPTAVR
jgi:hypothetical protein